MSLYLLMMAAIMSVPPVLPLDEKATPIPPPQNEAPMTHAMNGWSWSRLIPVAIFWITDKKKVKVNTPKIVLIQNFNPNNLRASKSKKKLMAKYVYCTGKPVAQYRPADAVQNHADGNHYIISGFTDNALFGGFWNSCFHKCIYFVSSAMCENGISTGDELFSMESLFSSVGRVGVATLGTKAAWVLGGCVQLSCQVSG